MGSVRSAGWIAVCAVTLSACGLFGGGGITPIRTPFNKGVYHYSQGNLDEAIAEFRDAIEEDPNDYRAHYNLGLALEARASVLARSDAGAAAAARESAEAAYETVVRLRPENVRAKINLAAMLYERGERDAAKQRLRAIMEQHPSLAIAPAALGARLLSEGDDEGAAELLGRACRLDPANANAWYLLGVTRQRRKDFDGARAAFQKVLVRHPSDLASLVALGELEIAADRLNEAQAYLESALFVDADHPRAHWLLAGVYGRRGEWENALAHYWKARDLTRDGAIREQCLQNIQKIYRTLLKESAGEKGKGSDS